MPSAPIRIFQVPQASLLCAATQKCPHNGKCEKWRIVASRTCRVCKRMIGFAVLVIDDPQKDLFQVGRGTLHLICDQVERGPVRVRVVRMSRRCAIVVPRK